MLHFTFIHVTHPPRIRWKKSVRFTKQKSLTKQTLLGYCNSCSSFHFPWLVPHHFGDRFITVCVLCDTSMHPINLLLLKFMWPFSLLMFATALVHVLQILYPSGRDLPPSCLPWSDLFLQLSSMPCFFSLSTFMVPCSMTSPTWQCYDSLLQLFVITLLQSRASLAHLGIVCSRPDTMVCIKTLTSGHNSKKTLSA